MGMYDILKISTSKLPLTEEEKATIGDNIGWQTKDFECILSTVEIEDNGKLRFFDSNEQWIEVEDMEYVNFYSDSKIGWLEFNARFNDGQLSSIERSYFYNFVKKLIEKLNS